MSEKPKLPPPGKPVLRLGKPSSKKTQPLVNNPFLKGAKISKPESDNGETTKAELSKNAIENEKHKEQQPSNNASEKKASPHRKPKYRQFIPKSSNEIGKNNMLVSLMDDDYTQEDMNNEQDSNLKIEGLEYILLPHQRVGVNFLCRRERGVKYGKGGLLADDMGLGKTIQSIGLMLVNKQTKKDEIKTTLVVVPLALLEQWKEEINRMAPKLTVTTHHGASRETDISELLKYDVIITTFNVVASEYDASLKNKPQVLFDGPFFRIIADEAHSFRNPSTKTAEAMCAIQTVNNARRWALTGTPIHNKISDLLTLLKFIGCDLLENGISPSDVSSLKIVLKTLMLRRGQKVLAGKIPSLLKEKRMVRLNPNEKMAYEKFLSTGGIPMFKLLVRLRQCCDGLFTNTTKDEIIDEKFTIPLQEKDEKDENDEKDILESLLTTLSLTHDAKNETEYYGYNNSKIQEIKNILLENPQRKTVIFSTFVTMLKSLEPMLQHEGFTYLLYDGSLSNFKRNEILHDFRNEKKHITILLCSLSASAVGLNLTSGSQVIMVEPWWNPQIVDQAIKRVHRLGQKNEVRCIEIFAADCVDERILKVQVEKRKLSESLLDKSDELTKQNISYLIFGDEKEHHATSDMHDSYDTAKTYQKSKHTIANEHKNSNSQIRPKLNSYDSKESRMNQIKEIPEWVSPKYIMPLKIKKK